MPYERSAGTALATVQSWCRHLTNAGTFDATTAPTVTQVNSFLALAQADLMAILVRYDYGTAAPTDQNGLAWLEKMNCIRACIDIEMSYPITEWGQPNQRMTMFEQQWVEGTALIATRLLDAIGLDSGAGNLSDGLTFTGISLSRKQSREEETDRVAGKFVRGFGQSYRSPEISRRYSTETIFDPNS